MPILGVVASSYRSGVVDTGAMFPLTVVTVGAGGMSSVSLTNIPNTYAHLQLRVYVTRNSANSTPFVQFNNDTALGSYGAWHMLYGDGFTPNTFSDNRAHIPVANVWDGTDTTYSGAGIIDILDYANVNKFKTVRSIGGIDKNGGGSINLISGKWQSLSAITSIQISASGGLGNNSTLALYGIKGA